MSDIYISCDPSGKSVSESRIIVIGLGRSVGKQHMIRELSKRQNIVMIDDIDTKLEKQPNISKWVETYFPKYFNLVRPIFPIHKIEKQNIKLGVKKRYTKAPKINMLSGREYYNFHFQLTQKIMRQKKYPKRPTLKAESIFETEKRLQRQAKHISQTFVHTKPIKYLLK